MKTGRIFWGVLFVAIGILLLLERTGILYVEWGWIWKFWPLILVVWGAVILLGNKQPGRTIVLVLLALGVALFVLGIFNFGWAWHSHDWQADAAGEYDQELSQPYDSTVHRASFTFESGAGTFVLEDTTSQLIDASTRSNFGHYICEAEKTEDSQHVTLQLAGNKQRWWGGRMNNHVRIRLNSAPLWDMRFEVGASSMDVDLSRYAVERLVLATGASSVNLTLGDRANETRVSVKTGVSSLRVHIPDASGCEIRAEAPLSSKDFRGFTKIHSGVYQTENFDSASKKIYIDVHAGVSSLSVKRVGV
jgi:hypothetical protein